MFRKHIYLILSFFGLVTLGSFHFTTLFTLPVLDFERVGPSVQICFLVFFIPLVWGFLKLYSNTFNPKEYGKFGFLMLFSLFFSLNLSRFVPGFFDPKNLECSATVETKRTGLIDELYTPELYVSGFKGCRLRITNFPVSWWVYRRVQSGQKIYISEGKFSFSYRLEASY